MSNKRVRAKIINLISICVFFFICFGCGKGVSSVNKIEIYYRDFSKLSPYSYSSAELERTAPGEILVANPEDIKELLSFLETPCKEVYGLDRSKMDVFLLMKLYRKSGVSTLEASDFHYYLSSSRQTCILNRGDREKIQAAIAKLAPV